MNLKKSGSEVIIYEGGYEEDKQVRRRCSLEVDDETIEAYLLDKLDKWEKLLIEHHLEYERCDECVRKILEISLHLRIGCHENKF